MKKIAKALVLCMLLCALAAAALAAPAVPKEIKLEESSTHDYGTIKVKIDRWLHAFGKFDLRYFVIHIETSDPRQLQTAFAGEAYSKRNVEATSDIAARHDALLAINGDYYNYKDDYGMIIRNGVLYRDAGSTRDHLLVYADGTFKGIYAKDYIKGEGQRFIDAGVVQSFAFGPILVDKGQITELPEKYIVSTDDTIREPRTAIGQVDKNHYVLLIADGRRADWSDKGMTLQEMQQVFVQEGCRIAYNLDGGGSTTLIFEGEKINQSSGSRERDVSDIVYFTK